MPCRTESPFMPGTVIKTLSSISVAEWVRLRYSRDRRLRQGPGRLKATSASSPVKKEIVVELDKRVPIGLGMGSSGASAAAAAVAMNELLELGLSKDELIFYAGKG